MKRQVVRDTAEKVLRSDDMIGDEKQVAAAILLAHPLVGYPFAVRCDWCHEKRTLFRDESEPPFVLTGNGWVCETCEMNAASQEIRF